MGDFLWARYPCTERERESLHGESEQAGVAIVSRSRTSGTKTRAPINSRLKGLIEPAFKRNGHEDESLRRKRKGCSKERESGAADYKGTPRITHRLIIFDALVKQQWLQAQ